MHLNLSYSPLTLHVSNQQVALSLMVDPVLECTTLLSRLRVTSHQVDLFAVLDWILDKVPNQLFLQCGIGDVIGWTVNQVDGNDPVGSMKQCQTKEAERYCALCVHLIRHVTHSGTSPKASTDWAASVYALMYSLAVFWTWHSYRAQRKSQYFIYQWISTCENQQCFCSPFLLLFIVMFWLKCNGQHVGLLETIYCPSVYKLLMILIVSFHFHHVGTEKACCDTFMYSYVCWTTGVPWCSDLHSQAKVLLNTLVNVLGPVADRVVYFEHAGVSWQ